MSGQTHNFEVSDKDAGLRLDLFLTNRLPGRTRSALTRLIGQGLVLLDGQPATKPGHALKPGTRVSIMIPELPSSLPQPEQIPLEISFEDEHLLVVNKPAGLVVHPGHGCRSGTLVNALLGRETSLAATGGAERPGIVHRLDKGTSGLLIVAKTDQAHAALGRAFSKHEIDKRYLALVWGHPDPPAGTISKSIGRSRRDPTKMAVHGTRGRSRPAVSKYSTLESMRGFAWLEIFPRTGRTHQIRVHFQSLNHPLVGDDRYGGRAWRGVQDPLKRKALKEFNRLALHAANLSFMHPLSGKRLSFQAALPDQFSELLEVLRR